MSTTQPDGYLAVPDSGTGSGVLVLHAWWGLNDTIKSVCDRLAAAGFVAFAPDLYHGKVVDTIADAQVMTKALDAERATADIVEAVRFLNERATGDDGGVAVIAFSLGVYFALELSNNAPELFHSVVIFYGTGPTDYNASRAAYLGHFGEQDEYEPLEYVDEMEAAIHSAGRPVSFHVYPGTGHWFFEPDRPDAYQADAAALAWERTLAFLQAPSP